MSTVIMRCQEASLFTIICDDRCPVVRRLAALVGWWDRNKHFRFINRTASGVEDLRLVAELDRSPWSLLLIDENGERWLGPESIPIILKNLPFGKLAAVFYILPGTMWLTHQFYMLVSRNRHRFAPQKQA